MMKAPFSRRELKRICRDIKAVPGRYDSGDRLYVAIALPYGCSKATEHFGYQLMMALERVNCTANISMVLSFSRSIVSDQSYEVLPYIPIATPCIRLYERSNKTYPGRWVTFMNQIKRWCCKAINKVNR